MRKYIVTDITYCARDCANTECKRNKKHVENYNGFLSWANFVDCEEWKDEQSTKQL